MLAREKQILLIALKHCRAAGFEPYRVWDGEAYQKATTDDEVVAAVDSVDDSMVCVRRPMQRGHSMRFILGNGNDGRDVLCDHSVGEGFSEAMDAAYAEAEALP